MSNPTDAQRAEAIASEQEIADEAAEIRSEANADDGLTAELFMKLYPLLCLPIPSGFIQTIPPTEGKPYESTGVRSVQVQIDRMNNVLTPLWWWYDEHFEDGGKLALVTVIVGNRFHKEEHREIMVRRTSHGGVGRGSGSGNIYKGSFTNAAKLAIARVGPGHEVYLGAADLDPDVNREVAEQKVASNGAPAADSHIGPGIAGKLVNRAWKVASAKTSLRLAASHAADSDVGDCSNKKSAVEGLAGLTYEQAEKLDRWLTKKETEAEVDAPAPKESGDE